MIEKKKFKRDYINTQTRYTETNNNSANILNITFMPELFTAGKNLFRFKPNSMFISKTFPINIEILDLNGNPIYHEVLRKKERDKSINVAVYGYDSVPVGECSITILCTVYRDLNGILLPNNQVQKYNYKYIHTLSVDKTKVNDSEIIFAKEPKITLEEKKFSIVEEKFTNQKPSGSIGFATYSLIDSVPTLTNFSNAFRKEFEGGKIFFPTLSSTRFPSAATASFEYSSSIVAVVNPNQLILKDPVYFSGVDGTYRPVSTIANQEYDISYSNLADSRTVTQNVKSYAKLDISNLETEVGNVSNIKVSVKSPNRSAQAYEFDVNKNNFLIDPDSNLIENPIGTFSKNVSLDFAGVPTTSSLSTYNFWKTISVNGAPPAIIGSSSYQTSEYVFDSISIIPSTTMFDLQEIILEQTGSAATQFYKDTIYKISFDYYNTDNVLDTREKKIAVYVSGSAFRNNTEYGRYLGKVPTYTGAESIKKDFELRIPVDKDGTGVLRFMMRDGAKISNIRILSDSVYGFTPNRARVYVPIDQSYKNEYLDFKIQYFNNTLKESQVSSSVQGVFFGGGNQYIYGDDNIITGSTYISPYTASGIQLYGNISGSKSGSAIQSYGYNSIEFARTGTPVINNYGWSLTQGNPYSSASYSTATVQMINQSGSSFEFRSNPDTFNFNAVGSNSTVLIGNSGSVSSSYLKWDGTNLVIYVSGSLLSSTSASYASTASWAINFTGVAVAALSATSASYASTASVLSNSDGNITITGGTTYDNLYFGGTASQSIEASVSGVDAGGVNLYFGSTTGFRDYRFAWQNDRNVVLYGAGGIAVWSTGTATSDYILKRNVKPTEINGIETLKKLNVVDFQWKEDTDLQDGGVIHTGFVAQEIENVIPDAVYSPSGSTKLLHKEELVPTLVKALQEAVHRIEELEKRLLVSDN